jgi:diguanylate cyclase
MALSWLYWTPITFPTLSVGFPEAAALAAVALIGYLFGTRTRRLIMAALGSRRQRELERASRIAWQLETIAASLRKELASHHSQIASFKRRLREAQEEGNDKSWERLCAEAETMLHPTMELAQQLAHAYDQIRQQSDALETFTRNRTDPLTGVGNGRALEQQLDVLLKSAKRGGADFAVALVSLDRHRVPSTCPEDLQHERRRLQELARVIQSCVRDTDFVARYGDEEFVVVMPQTSLAGACVFADRLRSQVAERLVATIGCGLAEYQANDTVKVLFARADSAFYSAKAAGTNRLFLHTGNHIREHHAGQVATGDSLGRAPGMAPGVELPAEDDDGPARAALSLPASESLEPPPSDGDAAAPPTTIPGTNATQPQPR